MKAVVTVIGRDMVGILSKVTAICAEHNVNVIEVTQSIVQNMFAMIMIVDISRATVPFSTFVDRIETFGKEANLQIHAMHEDVFNSMHHV